jgi:hypothetical protein
MEFIPETRQEAIRHNKQRMLKMPPEERLRYKRQKRAQRLADREGWREDMAEIEEEVAHKIAGSDRIVVNALVHSLRDSAKTVEEIASETRLPHPTVDEHLDDLLALTKEWRLGYRRAGHPCFSVDSSERYYLIR